MIGWTFEGVRPPLRFLWWKWSKALADPKRHYQQGCQIFLGTWDHNRDKYTKLAQNLSNCHKISQMSVKYRKWPWYIPTISNLRPSKIYPNWYFWSENKPSGDPDYQPRILNSIIMQRSAVGHRNWGGRRRNILIIAFRTDGPGPASSTACVK
jgi:hypothetical protein